MSCSRLFFLPQKWAVQEGWSLQQSLVLKPCCVFPPGRCCPCPQCPSWMITSATTPSWRIPRDFWMPTWTSSTPSELPSHSLLKGKTGKAGKTLIFVTLCSHLHPELPNWVKILGEPEKLGEKQDALLSLPSLERQRFKSTLNQNFLLPSSPWLGKKLQQQGEAEIPSQNPSSPSLLPFPVFHMGFFPVFTQENAALRFGCYLTQSSENWICLKEFNLSLYIDFSVWKKRQSQKYCKNLEVWGGFELFVLGV